jgi:hypothetical protein
MARVSWLDSSAQVTGSRLVVWERTCAAEIAALRMCASSTGLRWRSGVTTSLSQM